MKTIQQSLLQAVEWAERGQACELSPGETRAYKQSTWDCGTACCLYGAFELIHYGTVATEGPRPELCEAFPVVASLMHVADERVLPVIAAIVRGGTGESEAVKAREDGLMVYVGEQESHGQAGGEARLFGKSQSHSQAGGWAWLSANSQSHSQAGGVAILSANSQSHGQAGGVAWLYGKSQSHSQAGGVASLSANSQSHGLNGGTVRVRSADAKVLNPVKGVVVYEELRDGAWRETRRETFGEGVANGG